MSNRGGYRFKVGICGKCGCEVADNWHVAHRKSGCKRGIHHPPKPASERKPRPGWGRKPLNIVWPENTLDF